MATDLISVGIDVNGKLYRDEIPSDMLLIDYLREVRGLTGTKRSCGEGECGTCSVLVNGNLVYSCIMLAVQADGKSVETIEGLSSDCELHPIQQAFVDAGAIQCGYCTPAMVLATKALLDHNPHPDEEAIREGISGNLCRCTGYVKIMDAVKRAADYLAAKGANHGG